LTDRPHSLDAIEAEIWRQLELATSDRQHAWRTPVLATVSDEAADARTVILREVNARDRQLFVYSDQRARKVAQLLRHPRGMLVMWSPTLGWQLRCSVVLSLEMNGLAAQSRWARIRLTPAAQDYLSPLPPGARLESPPADPASADESRATSAQHDYFAVVNAQVLSVDWLELHRDGHRRAIFSGDEARWVQP